jgi:hypothetical protein
VPEPTQPSGGRIAFAIAWFGLGASLLVHVVSFFGASLFERFLLLHVGVFALGIPASFSRKNRQLRTSWRAPWQSWRTLLQGAPPWAVRVLFVEWPYFVVNMAVLFILGEGGSPKAQDGHFILQGHGGVIRELTEAEYRNWPTCPGCSRRDGRWHTRSSCSGTGFLDEPFAPRPAEATARVEHAPRCTGADPSPP